MVACPHRQMMPCLNVPSPQPSPKGRGGRNGRTVLEPTLLTPAEVCEKLKLSGAGAVIGDHLPDYDWPADVTLLTGDHATPRAEVLWQLGLRRRESRSVC